MAEYAELLLEEQSNPAAALLQILISDYKSYDTIAAVEGPDDRVFYYDFLSGYLDGQDIFIIDCGGKRGVLGLKTLVDQYEWDLRPRVLYLCDQDYDEFIQSKTEGVHYLPVYSIESYFSCAAFVDYVISKFAKSPLTQSEKEQLIEAFVVIFMKMAASLRLVSAVMIEKRARGHHPDFDELSIADFFDLTVDPPRAKPGKWTLIRKSWGSEGMLGSELRTRVRQLEPCNVLVWLRGKYALQIAKTSFQRALKHVPKKVAEKCPDSNCFSSEAFKWAKLYLKDIASLEAYCEGT